jgi:hypothetical protein
MTTAHHHEQDDVTVREIPRLRYAAIGWAVLAIFLLAMAAWELRMRSLGLRAGDLGDTPSHWAVERARLETGDHDGVVIVGQSRILFDTDLGVWTEMTGRTPVQLALPGTNARPYLVSIAEDTDFSGLVVCDIQQESYFSDWRGGLPMFVGMEKSWRDESPSEKFGHRAGLVLSRRLAFLDDNYSLFSLIDRTRIENDRAGFDGPYFDVWKLSESSERRQYFLWHRIESDGYLREHARQAWSPPGKRPRPPLPQEQIDKAIAESAAAIRKIRGRGGEVVFIRPPSTGLYLEREEAGAPRARTWDRLLAETGAFGIHFEDYPEMQGLEIPEWSHLTREDATRYTRAYVGVLRERYVWLRPGAVVHPGT